jgi:dihydrodipicolinate synthase/N-acetylneuraminate lyase
LNYYLEIANAVPQFPIFLYNIPGNAKNELRPELVVEVASNADNVVGIKHSGGDLYSIEKYTEIEGFTVICGSDRLVLPALMAGAKGSVSSTANSFPAPFVALYNAFVQGDFDTARDQQATIRHLTEIMKDGAFVAPYKLVLAWKGIIGDAVRCPQRKMTAMEAQEIQEALRDMAML